MKILSLLLILPLSVNAVTICDKYTRKIDNIKAQMRQGYTVRQGEYLKRRLTQLQDDRIRCEREIEQVTKARQQKYWYKKNQAAKKDLGQIANQHNANSNWTATSPSKARLEKWKQLQAAENKKLEALRKKHKGVIVEDAP